MRTINPFWSASRLADRQIKDGLRARKRWGLRVKGATAYFDGTHRYELMENQKATGKFSVMMGRQAKALNDSLRADFVLIVRQTIDAGKAVTEPLRRWCVRERNVPAAAASKKDSVEP